MWTPIEWKGDCLVLLDQRKLPRDEQYLVCNSWEDVSRAISDMVVRGAPAIGITAAYAVVLGAHSLGPNLSVESLEPIVNAISRARPTAVNLVWALNRMMDFAHDASPLTVELLEATARQIELHDRQMCASMGSHGADYLGSIGAVLTHCNTGALATGGEGTALAVIRELHRRSPLNRIFVDETRPYLQGSRLTAWELQQDGLPACLITDSMAGYMMSKGLVDAVLVGADRIAENGDVANKIGTYALAVLCKHHQIPFIVVAPTSTVDLECPNGAAIEIEDRGLDELKFVGGIQIAPEGVAGMNPAFDVTPFELVSAIITEVGIVPAGQAERLREHVSLAPPLPER